MRKVRGKSTKMSFKYQFLLHKAFFDKGWALTNYFKYVIAFFGLASTNLKATMWIAVFYAIACYFIGIAWFKYGFVDLENEVQNNFNPFVKDVRKELKKNGLHK